MAVHALYFLVVADPSVSLDIREDLVAKRSKQF